MRSAINSFSHRPQSNNRRFAGYAPDPHRERTYILNLSEQIAAALDGPLHQLWEKSLEQGEIQEITLGPHGSAVNVG